jgi:hypothetical protein
VTARRWQWLILGGVLLAARPSGSAPEDDGVPRGMVAFFVGASGCPAGWVTASEAAGRMLVAVDDSNSLGRRIGVPLGDRDDPSHTHAFTASGTIAVKNLAAADGGNQSAAQPGVLATTGTTLPARTGLPFVQLVVCKKP